MKNYLKSITAKTNAVKFHYDDGKSSKFMSYIEALNEIYGYGLINSKEIEVEPEDLVCPEKELNTIIANLYKYFNTILNVEIVWDFKTPLTLDGKFCYGFGIYGESKIKLVKR